MSLADNINKALDEALGKAAEEGRNLAERRGGEYFDDLIERGDALADGLEDEDLKQEAKKALDELESVKTPLLRLTDIGLARLLGHWQDDSEAQARRFYLEHKATYMERRRAMWAASDGLIDSEDARRKAWEEVEGALKRIGKRGLKFVGGILLGMIGL